MTEVNIDDLKYKSEYGINAGIYQDGYRIVYFDNNGDYSIGAFSGTIEDFMINFADEDPIDDDTKIPSFTSNEDLLDRYLNKLIDISAIAIYTTDGKCIVKKERKNLKKQI